MNYHKCTLCHKLIPNFLSSSNFVLVLILEAILTLINLTRLSGAFSFSFTKLEHKTLLMKRFERKKVERREN